VTNEHRFPQPKSPAFENREDRGSLSCGSFREHREEGWASPDEFFVEDSLLVHLLDQGSNFLVGKLVDVVAEENLIFGKRGQRRGNGSLQRSFGHGKTLNRQDRTGDSSTFPAGFGGRLAAMCRLRFVPTLSQRTLKDGPSRLREESGLNSSLPSN